MAGETRIFNDETLSDYISSGEHWYYVIFNKNGKANFFVDPDNSLDVDLYLYDEDKDTLLGRSMTGTGVNCYIRSISVDQGKKYYIKVKRSKGSGEYQIRCKVYKPFYDLGIKDIVYRYKDASDTHTYFPANEGTIFELDRRIKFKVNVKNYDDEFSPGYQVVVLDENGNELDNDYQSGLEPSEEDEATLTIDAVNNPGQRTLKFSIIPDGNHWIDTYVTNNHVYRHYNWGYTNIKISFDSGIDSSVVSNYSINVIKQILKNSNLTSARITSTIRTPSRQARIMYDNCEEHGTKSQYDLYSTDGGDKVIDVYAAGKAAGKTRDVIIEEMTAKIIALLPIRTSKHCVSYDVYAKLNVIDIGMSSISNKTAFENQLNVAKSQGILSKILVENDLKCYHLEIPVL